MKSFLCLGDSITDCDHLFDPSNLGTGYVSMLAEQLSDTEWHVYNHGHDGFTTKRLHPVWNRVHTSLNPDVTTLLIGVNDICTAMTIQQSLDISIKDFQQNYRRLLFSILTQSDTKLILMEPFLFARPALYLNWFPLRTQFSEIIQSCIQDLMPEYKNRIAYIPLQALLTEHCEKYGFDAVTIDGIHLTTYGHEILTAQILDIL